MILIFGDQPVLKGFSTMFGTAYVYFLPGVR